ncbi:polyamine aminopropyltransferase [Candidatus Micrarchaeota archaeon]|nr:polyamine aminopropyltransferase [Candidatus Micrarchaeota archaeon]
MSEDKVIYSLNPNARVTLSGTVVARKSTPYQELTVFDSPVLGRMLLIGSGDCRIIQFSTRDEKYYHEAIAHSVLGAHPNPKNVLIIGGGDGGTLREVLKHPVERVVLAELDDEVIGFSKEFFPSLSDGAFEDSRLELKIGDGRKFLEETEERFDIVIMDLTDPEGPSTMLFTKEFYTLVKSKMGEGGILSVQTGSPVFEGLIHGRVQAALAQVFRNAIGYAAFVQSFFIVESYVLATDSKVEGIARRLKERNIKLEAYTPEQVEALVLQPHGHVREILSMDWEPSTDANPADISEVRW